MDDKDKTLYVKESLRKEQQYSVENRYTYADYANWGTEDRYELIDGIAYMMSAPSQSHQETLGALFVQFYIFLKGKPCKVFLAPFDVCLNAAGDKDDTVVQPDLIVVCDKSKLDSKRCNGAPDLAVEILSPSNRKHDTVRKLNKYFQVGVQEYWMVDPDAQTVQVCILKDGKYDIKDYSDSDIIPVHVLDGCMINMQEAQFSKKLIDYPI
jgi:Uma2 family endonuclease